jgi:hypothetical protein
VAHARVGELADAREPFRVPQIVWRAKVRTVRGTSLPSSGERRARLIIESASCTRAATRRQRSVAPGLGRVPPHRRPALGEGLT